MKRITVAFCLVLAVAMSGCGDEARSTSETVGGLVGAFAGSSATSSSMALNAHLEKVEALRESARYNTAQNARRHGEMFLELAQSDLGIQTDLCTTLESAIEEGAQAGIDDQCAVTGCSATATAISYTLTCSSMDQTLACGSDSYTLSDFTYASTVSFDLTSYQVTLGMSMDGDVSGAASGTLDCDIGFTMNLQDTSAESEIDCEDLDYSCTLAGAAITCEELSSSAGSASCQ